ncbi:hypothetical protein DFP72DRAFT_870850 [Ephemerocybe angulata]|uniref:RING-type domain-containing protein n=1 Tax=Ephemerocybe angulata TaxID=980116 RepID=A0A8H6MG29_9AGAR|nr:hypothetical protein DFP72DRAFT_870850 [Tulosesus angulatus]
MSLLNWNQFHNTLLGRRTQPTTRATSVNTHLAPAVAGPVTTGTGIDHLLPQNDTNGNASTRDKKTLDPLFGPNIGAVTSGPAWTATVDKKIVTDDLTQEVVTTWMEKSKDSSQPTTTLQALVNLKRPTIKLSPLHPEESDEAEHSQPHGLEFEYDCDAPKCGIYVHVFLPKSHPDAPPTPPHHALAKLLVFENVVDGGFGKHLKLDEGAILELGQFEDIPEQRAKEGQEPSPPKVEDPEGSAAAVPSVAFQEPNTRNRRRFTALRFRRGHGHNRSISGPALAVVDAEPQGTQEGAPTKKEGKVEDDGVKVTIRLAALDDQGAELTNINEQVTYLHIVRVGQKPAEPVEDARPWVVKVVKREATIGPHTFHLHEIYGLTSTSTAKPAEPATPNYPPVDVPVITDLDDDPQSECLLCLSSPREVVLLPCRHLVACKECALNMVEFGAGGNITHSEVTPTSPAVAGAEEGTTPEGGAEATQTPTGGITVVNLASGTATTRRKRKAKGWFCPVCRQPYSSLLRITTAPPSFNPSNELTDNGPVLNSLTEGLPTLASLPTGEGSHDHETSPRTGFLGNTFRPNFLRTLTGRGAQQQPAVEMSTAAGRAPALPLDVESVGGLGRVGS